MSLQTFSRFIVKHPGNCILDGSVHAFGLTIGPRMIRPGQPVLDAVLFAAAVERMLHGVLLGACPFQAVSELLYMPGLDRQGLSCRGGNARVPFGSSNERFGFQYGSDRKAAAQRLNM